jgi:nicotinamide-nucleotide amidase
MRIEKVIGELLRDKGWTLAIAESCTGGLVSDLITNVAGSSDYFEGGIVTYSNRAKTEHLDVPSNAIKRYGAVSPQVAIKMAHGVRKAFHSTFGVSITGIAGPGGGSRKKPVGLVFIAVSDGKKTLVKEERLKGSRREIKKESARRSLKYLYDFIANAPCLEGAFQP